MKLRVDRESDALYFRLTEADVYESEEVKPGIILDFDEAGNVVGVEMLAISVRVEPEMLRVFQFETT